MLLAALLVTAFLYPVEAINYRYRHLISLTAALWSLFVFLHSIFKLADIFAGTLSDIFNEPRTLASFFLQVRLGQVFLAQIIAGLIIAAAAQLLRSKTQFRAILIFTVASLLPPSLTGHSGGLQFHELAVASWGVHIVAISLWSGGVLALLYVSIRNFEHLRRSFGVVSNINFACYIAVISSGTISAWLRIPSWSSLFQSPYGRLLLAKFFIFILLGAIGAAIRLRLRKEVSPQYLTKILSIEIFLMGLAIMLGVLLSSTKFPIGIPQ